MSDFYDSAWRSYDIPETLGMQYIRLKDRKNEHHDEEEDVGRQNGHLVNAILGYYADVISIYK